MRFSAPFLSIVALSALFVPALPTLGASLDLNEQLTQTELPTLAQTSNTSARQAEADRLFNEGGQQYNASQYQAAFESWQAALEIYREIDNPRGEGQTLNALGLLFRIAGQPQTAIDYHEQALAIAREVGSRAGEGIALNNQGAAMLATEQFPESESALRQAMDVFESLRAELPDNQLISLADTQARTYANLERALVAQDKTAEALAISERGRARAFVLQLANRLNSSTEASLAEAPTVAEIQQIARDTNTTLVTYSLIFDQALYIWVIPPTGDISFRSVAFDGSDGPTVNPIASLDRPIYRSAPDSELTALVNGSRSIGVEATNPATNRQSLQSLHTTLIDPIADLLPSDPNDQVAFIPQGNLFLVPFAALQYADGTYLIEKHTILIAPSIQVFGLAHEGFVRANGHSPLQTDNALIVGNPTMPTVWLPNLTGEFAQTTLAPLSGAQLEAETIGELFQIPVLTGDQASEARIKQLLPEASLIHLATHGLLEYGNPETSGVLDVPGAVALAPGNGEDGLLTSAEILEMDLQAELAILSACDTGRGRITGDGVVGLSRALITAGVPSVMVSLWAVNDDSTSLLMQRFYELLASGELTKAQALRQAQLSLLYDEDTETRLEAIRAGAPPRLLNGTDLNGYQQPYHWAPFVLMGDGS
jgi:CHAT domain-containing protein